MKTILIKLIRFPDWPLRVKVLAVLLLASTGPLLALSIIGAGVAYQSEINHYNIRLGVLTKDISSDLNELNWEHVFWADVLGRQWEAVKEYHDAPKDPRPRLKRVLDFIEEYQKQRRIDNQRPVRVHAVAFLTPMGKVLKDAPEKSTVSELDLDSKENLFIKDARDKKKLVRSDVYLATDLGGKWTVAYAQPVLDKQNNVVAIGVIWTNAKVIWESLHQHHDDFMEAHFVLFDDRGERIGDTRCDLMKDDPASEENRKDPFLLNENARVNTPELDKAVRDAKQKVVLDSKEIPGMDRPPGSKRSLGTARRIAPSNEEKTTSGAEPLDWTVFGMVPEAMVTHHARMSAWMWGAALGLAMAGLSLIGGVLLARTILKPIRALDRSMEAFGRGQWDARAPVEADDEPGRLAVGFNKMAEQLVETVTSLKQANAAQLASQAQLRAIMDTAADGLITVTRDGNVDSFNRAATRIFGYEPGEIVGRSVGLLLVGPNGDWSDGELARCLGISGTESGAAPHDVEGKRQDGSSVPLELAVGRVEGGDRQLFAVSVHDLTRRKKTEEELRCARDDAEAATRTKSQLLANMGHELRTPLTSIIGYTEILIEDVVEGGHDEFKPDLELVLGQGRHLLQLINDLLDLSIREVGKLELNPETFELTRFLRDIAAVIEPLVAKNANRLELDVPANLGTMHADTFRLKQCLLNLLSNAAKFTDRGMIRLKVERLMVGDVDSILFAVQDSGIGMSQEQVQKLFQAFTQADSSTTRKFGGAGLGLAITRSLCQLMGGDVQVVSAPGAGSTFTITLPATSSKPAPPAPQPRPRELRHATAGAATILVADDDPAVRDMLDRVLTKEGFDVVLADSGDECLRLARELRPRAITLDVMMAGIDGWSVLSALKADPDLSCIPVIMVTIVDDKNLGMSLGAADYLTKPLDRERLVSALKRHCAVGTKRIALIAEDDPAARDLLRRTLEKDGWRIAEAGNGREALDHMAESLPDVILLDLMMPEIDGFEFLEEVGRHPEWRKVPVVVITAKELTEEDRLFLNGSMMLSGRVKRLLQKGTFTLDDLARQVRDLAATAG